MLVVRKLERGKQLAGTGSYSMLTAYIIHWRTVCYLLGYAGSASRLRLLRTGWSMIASWSTVSIHTIDILWKVHWWQSLIYTQKRHWSLHILYWSYAGYRFVSCLYAKPRSDAAEVSVSFDFYYLIWCAPKETLLIYAYLQAHTYRSCISKKRKIKTNISVFWMQEKRKLMDDEIYCVMWYMKSLL